MEYVFNMEQTLALAIVVLLIGSFIRGKVTFFQKFCIPAPVIGGVLFSLIFLVAHNTGAFSIKLDGILRPFLMLAFFTTIGFSASFEILRKGGIGVVIFLGVATGLVILQNALGVGLAQLLGQHPFLGLAAGSIPMTGGHGTSGAFGPILETLSPGTQTAAFAAATYGLIVGCLVGGPVGKFLVSKNKLKADEGEVAAKASGDDNAEKVTESSLFMAIVLIALAMGIGATMKPYLDKLMTLPVYISSMLIAAVLRNTYDSIGKKMPMNEIGIVGNISLSIFLAMALMSLKLWELADIAGPLLIILIGQTVLMVLYAIFITFNCMGRDYSAAVMACGHCGFGMGATPNAMANMETFTKSYGYSTKAFFIVPLVGALFIDFTNAFVINTFVNFFG